jgi:hypothetical protein
MVLPIVDTKGVVWYNVSQLMPLYNLDWNLVKSRFTLEENCIKAEDFVYIVACAKNRYDYVNPKHEDTASCGICGKILFPDDEAYVDISNDMVLCDEHSIQDVDGHAHPFLDAYKL